MMMKLAVISKSSSHKCTQHFDIKLFSVTDLVERQEILEEYCPTDKMIADYISKPTKATQAHKIN